ncbi:divergent polysaccharide deacetylase family protein [Maricaulis maris]|uniref:divergent polysaccharide deacetylase family protein n=1 Tax=Maricaulis maris TaxID=74318 RepID=UPI0026ED36F0|nr:divergent polysaccharide deacetylase family protein [Maricaulis maris]
MSKPVFAPLKARHSAIPAFAGALAAAAYLLGAVVFSVASKGDFPSFSVASADSSDHHLSVRVSRIRNFDSLENDGADVQATSLEAPIDIAASNMSPVVIAPADPQLSVIARPQIVLVIDDVGLDVAAAERVVALPIPLTVAILPYAEASAELAALARLNGHDVLLHMPMEPVGLADPGPNALRIGLSDVDLQTRLRWGMARVPGAIGLNNHMGSRFTADPRALRVALSAVSHTNPLFLDSLTTGESRGRAVAAGLGLRALERDIFLDHDRSAEAIEARLAEAAELARQDGFAVVIGHPHTLTLDTLTAWLESPAAQGIDFVTAGTLADQLFLAEPGLQASVAEGINRGAE